MAPLRLQSTLLGPTPHPAPACAISQTRLISSRRQSTPAQQGLCLPHSVQPWCKLLSERESAVRIPCVPAHADLPERTAFSLSHLHRNLRLPLALLSIRLLGRGSPFGWGWAGGVPSRGELVRRGSHTWPSQVLRSGLPFTCHHLSGFRGLICGHGICISSLSPSAPIV